MNCPQDQNLPEKNRFRSGWELQTGMFLRWLKRLLERCRSVSIPLSVRWSLSISALVILVMVSLGWFLITQQQSSYRYQSDLLGRMIVEQFARSASEPLLAGDSLALQVLVSQQEKNELIAGMQLLDLNGSALVTAGLGVDGLYLLEERDLPGSDTQAWIGQQDTIISYLQPVNFQGTRVGYAQVSIDRQPLEKNLRRLINALIATTVGLIILGTFLAIPLAHRLARPIHHLVKVGEDIDPGEMNGLEQGQRRDEIGRVLASFRRMAIGLQEKRQAEQALSRYLSPGVAQKVLEESGESRLGGTTAEASVLFCDIVGFTELSEELEPEKVSDLLNDYFRYFSLAGSGCQGTVDKFIGDCVMIVFGVPEKDEHHALHALTCAVLIQSIAQEINDKRSARGQSIVQFRVGINSGSMLAGNLGSEERMQYTVVGDVVNVASRLCDKAQPGGILLTEEGAKQPGMEIFAKPSRLGAITIRGRKNPITAYEVNMEAFTDALVIQESLATILAYDRGAG